MQQATEVQTEKSKLVRFVEKLTGSKKFPNIDSLASVADQRPELLGALYGVVSVAYSTGQRGLPLEEGTYSYISRDVPNEVLRGFLSAVHNEGRTKSGRINKPYFS